MMCMPLRALVNVRVRHRGIADWQDISLAVTLRAPRAEVPDTFRPEPRLNLATVLACFSSAQLFEEDSNHQAITETYGSVCQSVSIWLCILVIDRE